MQIAAAVDIVHFLEATSHVEPGPYDLSIVEGSVTTPKDAARIQEIREVSKKLVTIGACATAGGIQALRNFGDHAEMMRAVYAKPEYIDTLATSTAISAHIPVDFELRGCPIDKGQLIEVITAFVHGRTPAIRAHSTCMDCKARGNVCVTVAYGTPCLGPVTHAGCGALCPTYHRGCYGCFGPSEDAQPDTLAKDMLERGVQRPEVYRLLSNFNAAAEPFRKEAEQHGDQE